MFRKNLLKRTLPIVLSVAMTLQSVPVTAMAAEYEAPEAVVESVIDETVDDAQQTDGISEADSVSETDITDSVSESEEAAESASKEETQVSETKEDNSKEADTVLTDEVNDGKETIAADDAGEGDAGEGEPGTSDTKPAGTVISIDYSGIQRIIGEYDTYSYDALTKAVVAAYSENSSDAFEDILDEIKYAIKFYVNNSDEYNETLSNHAGYKWQKKNEVGEFVGMGDTEFPVNAGDYKLIISLPAVEGVCDAAKDAELNFRIDKKSVEVKYDGKDQVTIQPGTTVKEAKADILDNYSFKIGDIDFKKESDKKDNRSVYVENAAVIIKDAYNTAEALGDDIELLKTGDYVIDLELTLKPAYKENYEFENTHLNIVMSDAIDTIIEVTYTNQDGSDIGKIFDDQAISEEEVKKGYTAVVKADVNKDGKFDDDEVIDGANIVGVWKDADRNELTGAADVKDAGTYYYVLTYAGEDGKYDPSEDVEVPVVIQTANIVIDPQVSDKVVYENVTAGEALSTLSIDYKVYPVKEGTPDEANEIKNIGDYYWGVSYNQENATQSYEPTFAIMKITETITKVKGEDGTVTANDPVTTYEILGSGEEIKLEDEDTEELKKTVTYKLVFSGKKAVYNGYGYELNSDVDINASQGNYSVDYSNDILYKYGEDLDVKASENIEINVTPMYGENEAGKNYDNPITSTYNAAQLFGSRSEYKKASVTKEGTELPASYTEYEWQVLDHTTEVFVSKDENGELERDKKGNLVTNTGISLNESEITLIKESKEGNTYKMAVFTYWDGYTHNLGMDITPIEAGNYRIKVSYDTAQYHAEPKYVYYTIQKKNVLVKVNETPQLPTAYTGGSISNFVTMIQTSQDVEGGSYLGHEVAGYTLGADGNWTEDELPQTLKEYSAADNTPAHTYELYWYVERLIKEGPKKDTWETASGTFLKDEKYRLAVRLYFTDDDYNDSNNYNNCYKLDNHNFVMQDEDGNDEIAYENGTKGITVTESTGIPVTINVDYSKVVSLNKVYDGKTLSIDDTKIKDAVTFTNGKDGAVIPADEVKAAYKWYWDEEGVVSDEAIHAGTYYLAITTEQTDKYQAAYYYSYSDSDKKFSILPRELTVTPNLRDDIMAGEYIGSDSSARNLRASEPTVTGYEDIEADVEFFEGTYEGSYYDYDEENDNYYNYVKTPVTNYLSSKVYDKNDKLFSGYLRSSEQYYVMNSGRLLAVSVKNTGEQVFYPGDYKLVFEAAQFTPLRDTAIAASILDNEVNGIKRTRLYDDISGSAADGYTHTITTREGVRYSRGVQIDGLDKTEGNYFVFTITAPAEFINQDLRDTAVYENSIKAKGGYLLSKDYIYDYVDNYGDRVYGNRTVFTLVFDASAKDKKTFEIIWEDGYAETFTVDFSSSMLMDDLSKAVAPKSISFNGAVTKMSVGDSQQLDLKITKKQMSDIICVQYATSDENVLSVSESGYVTALKKGTATISAYPSYEDIDGKKVRLTDAKGNLVKGASVKITVSEVAAVKAIKTEAHDLDAYITYKNPTGGYRREIYVMEMSSKSDKKTIDTFETEIGKVVNGKYDAFATDPIFITNESAQSIYNGYYECILGLKPAQMYAVYVRNVSGLRTLVNGKEVANSHAGTIATFTTTKAQEKGLRFSEEKNKGYWNEEEERYEISVTDKKVPLYVEGRFYEYDSSVDTGDYRWYDLPLSKDDKQRENPKLTYYVSDTYPYAYDAEEWLGSKPVIINGYAFVQSKLATIDKTGKITPKGVGRVWVIVYNSVTKHWTALPLYITAKADTLTGKPIKMKVGTSVYLTDYLTYKQGKTTLAGYCKFDLDGYRGYDRKNDGLQDLTVDTPSNAEFDIEPVVGDDGVVRDYIITAKNPTKGKFAITVRDNVAGASASVALQASAIDPVKALKAKNVVDDHAYISFTYSALGAFEELADGNKLTFKIEVKDASGKIMQSMLKNPDELYNYNAQYKTPDGVAYADVKHTLYQYEYKIEHLTRLSNYTVSVSAVYDKHESKITSTKLKTTDIPASYNDVNADKHSRFVFDFYDYDYYETYGVLVPYNNEVSALINDDYYLDDLGYYPIFKSGNTYTLRFYGIGDANLMKTDALTWSSSDAKVASVKANAGTFTATLKAMKKGSAVISVTSKVTKKVVAKWEVFVNAVGEAEGYYGDNIRDRYDVVDLATSNNQGYYTGILGADVLTLKNTLRIKLTSGEGRWIAFTAPEYGRYTITAPSTAWVYNGRLNFLQKGSFSNTMRKGEQRYIFIENTNQKKVSEFTITATGTSYTTVTMGGTGAKVKGDSTIVFKVPEDNYYTFTLEENGNVVDSKSEALYKGAEEYITVNTFFENVDSSKEYVVKITSRQPEAITLDDNGDDASKSVTLAANGEKWYVFTADEAGKYTISATSTSQANTELFTNITDANASSTVETAKGDEETSAYSAKLVGRNFDKGDKLYIRLSSTEDNNTVTLKVERAKIVEEGKDQTVPAKDGEKHYVTYTAPSDGDYRFTAKYTEVKDLTVSVRVSVNGYDSGTLPQEKFNLAENDLVTFEITADGKDAEGKPLSTIVTIGVEKIEEKTIAIDGGAQPATVSDTAYERMTFTADKDGWYRYSFTVTEKNASTAQDGDSAAKYVPSVTVEVQDATGSYLGETANYGDSKEFDKVEYLKAGEARTLVIMGDEADIAVSANVTYEKFEDLKAGPNPITLTAGQTKRFKWTAAEGLYEFKDELSSKDANVTVKISAQPDDEGTSRDVSSLNGYSTKGETRYLTISSESAVTYTLTITATVVEQLTANPNGTYTGSYTLAANAEQWVELVAKTSNRYVYDVTGGTAQKYYSLNANWGTDLPVEGDVYDAGNKQYFKLTNDSDEAKTVSLTLSPVTFVDFTTASAGIKTGAKSEEGIWFRFKADDGNKARYKFTLESKRGDDSDSYTAYITRYTNDIMVNSNELMTTELSYQQINAGAYSYIFVEAPYYETTTEDNKAVDITLKAEKLAAAETDKLTLDVPKTVTFTKDKKVSYLEFTADEEGRYTFTTERPSSDTDTTMVLPSVEYYRNLSTSRTGSGRTYTIALVKGDKIVLKLTSNEDLTDKVQSVNVTVHKEEIKELTFGSEERITVKDGEVKYFSINSSERCRYYVEAYDVPENLRISKSLSSSNAPVTAQSNGGFYYSFVGTVGQKQIFTITSSISDPAPAEDGTQQQKPETLEFKIKAGVVETETIEAGASKTINTAAVKPNHMTWYSFTPAQEGRYTVKCATPSLGVKRFTSSIQTPSGSYEDLDFPYDEVVSEERVGKEIVYAVYYTDAKAANFDFAINNTTVKELTTTSPVPVDANQANEYIWVKFTAPADGRYIFTKSTEADITTDFYETIDSAYPYYPSYYGRFWGEEIGLEEEDEILFALHYTEALESAFNISVSSINPETLTVSETAKTIEFSNNNAKWFEFKSASGAIYQFDVTAEDGTAANVSMYRYAKLNDADTKRVSMRSGDTYGMDADSKVYIRLQPTSDIPEGSTIKISVKVTKTTDITKLNLSENPNIEVSAEGEKWLSFTAEKTGFYNFARNNSAARSGENIDIYRYNDVNASSGTIWTDSEFGYALNKGESIYFKLVNDSQASDSVSITVSMKSEIKELALGSSDSIGSMTSTDEKWYVFTAPEEGRYNISAGNSYVNLEIYTDPNAGYSDRYSGSYLAGFSKGEVIYIRVYAVRPVTNITISCGAVVEKYFSGEGEISFVLDKDEIAIVQWTAENSGYYNVSYSADEYVYYQYTDNNSNYSGSNNNGLFALSTQRGYGCELRLESRNSGNRITVSATKTLRELNLGSTTVSLDANDYETLKFTAPYDGDYIFLSESADSGAYAYLYSSYGSYLEYGGSGSGESNNFRIVHNLRAGEEVQLEVHGSYDYSSSFYVRTYRYSQSEAAISQDDYTQDISVETNQEAWIKFRATQNGYYEFGCGDNYSGVYMRLYELYGNSLGEVLGTKSAYSDSIIRTWLDADEEVMLRTYYGHSAGTYTITVKPGEIYQTSMSNWNVSTSSTSKRVYCYYDGYEVVMPCTFGTAGIYTFSMDAADMVIELYENDSETPIVSGNPVVYEYKPASDEIIQVSMKVHKGDRYERFDESIYSSHQYLKDEYELALDDDSNSKEVTVAAGIEAWFKFTAPESGYYEFSSNEDYVYRTLFDIEGNQLGYTQSSASSNIRVWLDNGQEVQLQTYYDSSRAAYTYTIAVAKGEIYQQGNYTWSISTSDNAQYYNWLSCSGNGSEVVIQCTFNTIGEYTFKMVDEYIDEDIDKDMVIEIYETDSETGLETLVAKGDLDNPAKYTYNPNPDSDETISVSIKIHKGEKYESFYNKRIASSHEYLHDDTVYELTLDDNSKEVTVAENQEAWFKFVAPESDIYKFSSTVAEDSSNYTYMDLYDMAGDKLESASYGGDDIKVCLDAGEEILLKTYYSGHSAGSYTIAVGTDKISETSYSWSISYNDSNSSKYVNIASGYEAVITCNFDTTDNSGTYTFYSDEEDVILELYEGDGDEETLIGAPGASVEYEYSDEEDKTIKLKARKGDKYRAFYTYIRVLYPYTHEEYELTLEDGAAEQEVTVVNGGEAWFKFVVPEAGVYTFSGSNYRVYGSLYAADEEIVTGSQIYYSPVKTWFDKDEEVLLKTYYNSHSSGTYTVTLSADELSSNNYSWSLSNSSNERSTYINISKNYEAVVTCNFSANGIYNIYSKDENANVVLELYVNDSETPLMSGSSIEFEYNSDEITSAILKVHNGKRYESYSGYIYAQYIYPHTEYELTLADNSREVTVSGGGEAWFSFTAPEAGTYSFYSKTEVSCDNYAALYVNGENVTYDDDAGGNGQFKINWDLEEGDVVSLRTYRYSHGSDEITYTVYVEKQ